MTRPPPRSTLFPSTPLSRSRDPRVTTRELYDLAVDVRAAIGTTPLIVNDRLDVALAARADGVHLGQSDLPVVRAREIAGPRSEEHTSELQSPCNLVCRLLLD